MKNFKVRASSAGKLMTDPRGKADKEAGILSKTAASVIHESFLKYEYECEDIIVTPPLLKGQLCESKALSLVSDTIPREEYRAKNRDHYSDDWFTGTPDCILFGTDEVEDIKCSFTLINYFNSELTKDYYAQGQVYMHLTKMKKFRLIYCMLDTPFDIVRSLEMKYFYRFGEDHDNSDYIDACNKIASMHIVEDRIPQEKRIKFVEFDRDQNYIDELRRRVDRARDYYSRLDINRFPSEI